MKLYRPIDGLLSDDKKPRKRWWLLGLPMLALAGFVVYLSFAGADIADERERRQFEESLKIEEAKRISAAVVEVTLARQGQAKAEVERLEKEGLGATSTGNATSRPTSSSSVSSTAGSGTRPQARKGAAGAVNGKLASGQSLFGALTAHELSISQIQPAINSLSTIFDFRKSRPKDRYEAHYDARGNILELRYQRNLEVVYVAKRGKEGKYAASKQDVPVKSKVVSIGGTVRGTLSRAIIDAGENQKLVSKFIDIFAYDIDFGSDTKPGDTFRLVFEKVYIEGKMVRYGNILAAEYKGVKKSMRAYRGGDGGYFDETGQSLRRMFLRNPVKFARITSKFGKRLHPVLKTWKQHNGVDYAAATGTPINPIANGTVLFAGEKGANGNLIAIQHPNGWVSYYAHLSRFGKIKKGSKVTQSMVVGYVGSTGRSTGPHLHLGVKRENGEFVDPLTIHSTRSVGLKGDKLRQHKRRVKEMIRKLDMTRIRPPSKGPEEPMPVGGDDMGGFEDKPATSGKPQKTTPHN